VTAFRWLIKRAVYDYFVSDTEPVLQINEDGVFWKDIPKVIIEYDKRTHKEHSNAQIRLFEKVLNTLPQVSQYPNTTDHLVVRGS
jgi:hypothetical protein